MQGCVPRPLNRQFSNGKPPGADGTAPGGVTGHALSTGGGPNCVPLLGAPPPAPVTCTPLPAPRQLPPHTPPAPATPPRYSGHQARTLAPLPPPPDPFPEYRPRSTPPPEPFGDKFSNLVRGRRGVGPGVVGRPKHPCHHPARTRPLLTNLSPRPFAPHFCMANHTYRPGAQRPRVRFPHQAPGAQSRLRAVQRTWSEPQGGPDSRVTAHGKLAGHVAGPPPTTQ